MKKFVLFLILVSLSIGCANAESINMHNLKKFFNVKEKPKTVKKESSSDELTKSEQATILYSDNNIKGAYDLLVSIKEEERTAQDWLLLGNILQEQAKNSDAVFMYQRAIKTDESFYKAYYDLGNIYLEDEKPYLAIENYRKANKINDEFPYAYYNLGCAYLRIGQLNKAKVAFLKAVELKKNEPSFHYNVAYTYKMLNKPKLAKTYLDNYNKLIQSMAQ